MGLFGRKKNNSEDLSQYGPLKLKVESCESRTANEIIVFCKILSGRVAAGETLVYKPLYGEPTPVKVESIESMMMQMQFAMADTAARFTLSGTFDMMDPTEGDSIERQ